MYNSYEEYMQNILGVNMPNTYMQGDTANYYYESRMQEANLSDVNKLYPEIYGIIYPMIQRACSRGNIGIINEARINEMVEEVYNAIEPGDDMLQGRETNNQRNTDTKNRGERETRRPNNNNYLLRDLIRILIIRELLGGGMQGGMPRPPMGGVPGASGRPPIIRPGYMGMY